METTRKIVKALGAIAREVSGALRAPRLARPVTNDPHEIEKYYIARYSPRKVIRRHTSAPSTMLPGQDPA